MDFEEYDKKIKELKLNYVPKNAGNKPCVAYLAYFNDQIGYQIDVVGGFLESYKNHPSGMEHDFVLIAKNWTVESEFEKLCELAKKYNAKMIYLPDDGFDFGAYIRASRILKNEYVFYIGSGSTILRDNWLKHLYSAFEYDSSVQIAGPMGSYETGRSGIFPNPHIRTCCFMMKRELFLEYADTQMFPKTKEDTWGMEHCKNSVSNYVINKGYKMAVVNSDGEIFFKDDWLISQTYTVPGENKGMLQDKWAKRYYIADEFFKMRLEMVIWGKNISKYPDNLIEDFSDKVNIFIPYDSLMKVYSSKVFHPIFIGDMNKTITTDALQDNATGDNISKKYPQYGETTAYYWIWKNFLPKTDSKYLGFSQFIHFLDFNQESKSKAAFRPIYIVHFQKMFENYTEENLLNCFEDYDVVLPSKLHIAGTVKDEYLRTQKPEDMDLFLNIIKKLYPDYSEAIEEALSAKSLYTIGCLVMKKEILSEFFEWLFSILFEAEKKIDWDNYGPYKDSMFSVFTIDRLLNIWLTYKKDLKIKQIASYIVYPDEATYLQKCLEEIQKAQQKLLNKGIG
jgi:hypothetical protein